MAVAVREMVEEQTVRPTLVAVDRRPYRCEGQKHDHGRCKRRIGDIEGDDTLLISCERCGQEHAFTLQTQRERDQQATIRSLLVLLATVSYAKGERA